MQIIRGLLTPADNTDIIGNPAVVRHTDFLSLAPGNRRGPEADFFKIIQSISGTAGGVLHASTVGAGGRNTRIGAEPDRKITLQVRRQRVFHPQVGAVRIARVGVQHRRIGPAGRTFLGNSR